MESARLHHSRSLLYETITANVFEAAAALTYNSNADRAPEILIIITTIFKRVF
jgi:hypothetical protein